MSRTLTDTSTITQDVSTPSVLKLNIPATAPLVGASAALGGATLGSDVFSASGTASFSSQIFASVASKAAPAYSFTGYPGYGLYFNTGSGPVFSHNGADAFGTRASTLALPGSSSVGWCAGSITQAIDTSIARDAAGILAQKNSSSPQMLRVYKDASAGNEVWATIDAGQTVSDTLTIGSRKNNTGTLPKLSFVADNTIRADYGSSSAGWTFTSGTTIFTGQCIAGNNAAIGLVLNGGSSSATIGTNAAGNPIVITGGSVLGFGGTGPTHPGLKDSGTTLQVRLADNSGDAPLTAASLALNAGSLSATTLNFGTANTGIYGPSSSQIAFSIGGTLAAYFTSGQFQLSTNTYINAQLYMYTGQPIQWNNDVYLYRDNAAILALKNGSSAQTLRIYKDGTVSAEQYAFIDAGKTDANSLSIGTIANGTGATNFKSIKFISENVTKLDFNASQSGKWSFAESVYFYKDLTFATSGTHTLGGASTGINLQYVWWNGSSNQNWLYLADGGNIALCGSTTGSFGGGANVVFISNNTAVPSTNPTGGGILYVDSGALKYRGSSGTVTTIAAA